MIQKFSGTVVRTLIIAAIAFLANSALYYFTDASAAGYHYPLYAIYLFFAVFSIIILGILTFISTKNKEQVGYVFLFLTAAKMGISYIFARPVLTTTIDAGAEKANFFFVFILFLAIEAYFTARLLNNK